MTQKELEEKKTPTAVAVMHGKVVAALPRKATVDGYENFLKLMKILDCKGRVMLYFHGSSDPAGSSWSPGCNKSGPVILDILKQNEAKSLHFVTVGVGTHREWMEVNCPFRTDEKVKLNKVPTLMLWRSQIRLIGKDCADGDKVKEIINNLP